GAELWQKWQDGAHSADLIASLTYVTAETIIRALRDFSPSFPEEIYIAGGGAHNPTLMTMLNTFAQPTIVATHDALGIPSTAKESVLFALLAYETWHNRPGVLTAFTRASHASVLGNITLGF